MAVTVYEISMKVLCTSGEDFWSVSPNSRARSENCTINDRELSKRRCHQAKTPVRIVFSKHFTAKLYMLTDSLLSFYANIFAGTISIPHHFGAILTTLLQNYFDHCLTFS